MNSDRSAESSARWFRRWRLFHRQGHRGRFHGYLDLLARLRPLSCSLVRRRQKPAA